MKKKGGKFRDQRKKTGERDPGKKKKRRCRLRENNKNKKKKTGLKKRKLPTIKRRWSQDGEGERRKPKLLRRKKENLSAEKEGVFDTEKVGA